VRSLNAKTSQMKKSSICHVAVGDLWAGAEVQLKILLSKLVQNPEFDLSVILFNQGRLEKAIEALDIPVRVFPESRWGSAKIFIELVREFKKSNIRIIHTHKYKDTILAAPAAKMCGISHVVRTVHGLREPLEGIQAMRMNLYGYVERKVQERWVDRIVAVSSDIERQYRTGGRGTKVTCIRNGIELDQGSGQPDRWAKRRELETEESTCLIGAVGRLTPVKGLGYLLKATKSLVDEGLDLKVLLVGDGVLRKDLEALAVELGIEKHVVFCGHRDDTQELMHALDIFVLPSLHEGIPMALLEAMAASRPVVASRVGGVPEVVDDGIEGFLVEPRDVKSLTERCQQLIQSPGLSRRMGEKARERVEQGFSAASMASQVALLYRELLTAE